MNRREFMKNSAIAAAVMASMPLLADTSITDPAILEQRRRAVEMLRCKTDIKYFLENYFYIQHPYYGPQLIKLNEYQHQFLDTIAEHKLVASVAARQTGKTTINMGSLLHRAIFNPHQSNVVVSDKIATVISEMDMIRFAYSRLPTWMQPKMVINNRCELKFGNGSTITAARSYIALRGRSVNLILVDEAAFIRNDEYVGFLTTSAADGANVVMTGTPNGIDNYFAQIYGQRPDYPIDPRWHLMKPYAHPNMSAMYGATRVIGDRKSMREFGAIFI